MKIAFDQLQVTIGIGFAAFDLLGRNLTVGDGVQSGNPHGDFTIGDGLNLQRVQAAEIGDLLETEGGIFDKPNGSRLGHKRQRT